MKLFFVGDLRWVTGEEMVFLKYRKTHLENPQILKQHTRVQLAIT